MSPADEQSIQAAGPGRKSALRNNLTSHSIVGQPPPAVAPVRKPAPAANRQAPVSPRLRVAPRGLTWFLVTESGYARFDSSVSSRRLTQFVVFTDAWLGPFAQKGARRKSRSPCYDVAALSQNKWRINITTQEGVDRIQRLNCDRTGQFWLVLSPGPQIECVSSSCLRTLSH
jgi:hypothetical protein